MPNQRAIPPSEEIFCIACGYPLRRIPSRRCPECGRPFDPNDARTVSVGRPLRRWQRALLRPVGWIPISIAAWATICLIYLGGRPHFAPEPWSVFVQELYPSLHPFLFWPGINTLGLPLLLWCAFLTLWVVGAAARFLVPKQARRCNKVGPDPWRRRLLIVMLALLSYLCISFGWQDRVGPKWMDDEYSLTFSLVFRTHPTPPPLHLSQEQAMIILPNLMIDCRSAEDRRRAMGLLWWYGRSDQSTPIALEQASSHESDEGLLVSEIRLVGLCRQSSSAPALLRWLVDPRHDVRAAAADALGIVHKPAYFGDPMGWFSIDDGHCFTDDTLHLDIREFSLNASGSSPRNQFEPIVELDSTVRSKLSETMANGASVDEREAASRALVSWPPDKYRLRYAEWGVWTEKDARLSLARSITDEAPAFVHGTGNSPGDFASYLSEYHSIIRKPIVHLTADRPLAVDLEVKIHQGRPWLAFPNPDDMAVDDTPSAGATPLFSWASWAQYPLPHAQNGLMWPPTAPLPDPREGYPWLVPHHRILGNRSREVFEVYQLGLRWQSLIVCPDRPNWMKPPTVPANPKFQWWSMLRDVPCSWVSSRGEADRFLYYDGPTRAPAPVTVAFDDSRRTLTFHAATTDYDPPVPPGSASPPAHEGIYIEVHDGRLSGQAMLTGPHTSIALQSPLPLDGTAVIDEFRKMLIRFGLTAPEAEGLICVWTPEFFQKEGRRFILRMSQPDYDAQCPMHIRPEPTERVRLGLILSEFDPIPASGDKPQ